VYLFRVVRAFLVLLAPSILAAQVPATGVISGRVATRLDSATVAPAAGAAVSLVGTARLVTTGVDGRFLFDRVPPGVFTLRVRLLGHRITERAIRVAAGDTVSVDIELGVEARLLSPVRVDADATDLETFLTRPNVATVTVSAAAMEGIPTLGEPDVARVVQLLPGVVARNDYNTSLNVRGGDADQNLILLDGHPIYNPFHVGGLFSTFMDATVGGIELLTGAFPARYGGRLSSVLDVRSADEARPGMQASADISVLAATARLGGALGDRGSWSVAGRRTYADVAARLFTSDVFPYHFRDFHGRATYALGNATRLGLTAYAGKDILDADLAEFESDSAPSRASEGRWGFEWGNRVIGLTIGRDIGTRAVLEQRVSYSDFSTLLDLGDGTFAQRSKIRDLRLGGSLLVRQGNHDLTLGYDVAAHRVRYASGSAQTGASDFDLVQRPVTAALWAGDLWRVSPRWLFEGGLRAESLNDRNWLALSPRLSVKFFAAPDLALTVGAGRVTQTLHSLAGDGPFRYFDVWLSSDATTPVASAWHWVAGAERRVKETGSIRIEGYLKHFDRVLEANWSENPAVQGDEFFRAKGRAYGVDVLARWQPSEGLAGWVAYSYGVSRRWRDTLRWAPGHDRRHDLDIVGAWRIAQYRVGARFGFATGTPYTPIVGEIARRVYDPSTDHWGTGDPPIRIESLGADRNTARYPATHRLDLDVSREFAMRGARVTPYVSVVNVYNAQNVFVYLYDYSTSTPSRRAISQFPILPSAGVRVVF
jgi:hypothetical protein